MSSYFDYYDNTKNEFVGLSENIQGTCNAMCPHEEVTLRIKEHIVHVLEVVGSEKKLVKCYTRSAADANMAIPHMLRPYHVLRRTVIYLLFEVTKRRVPTNVMYDFLNDRLRAVRQDMTIQRLPPEQCVVLLEPMVRFYVYFGYLLRDSAMKDFDPVLNKKHTLECLKWYLSCTDVKSRNEKGEDLVQCMMNMEIQDENQRLTCDRVLIESLYILCNLEDIHPLYRYIQLSKELRRNPNLLTCYHLAIAHHSGNYIKVGRLMDKLCTLTYSAVFLHLPVIQRRALQIMSHAYNGSRLTVPLRALKRCLKFSTEVEASTVCAHYGLKIDGENVRFEKNSFDLSVGLHKLQTQNHIKETTSIADMLTYSTDA